MKRLSDGRIDVTDGVDELSEGRRLIAFERACKVAGIEIEELESSEECMENPVFVEEFSAELIRMMLADDMAAARGEGLIEARVNEDGTLEHVMTPKGEALYG